MIWRNCFRLFLTLKQIQKMSELSRRSFFKKAGLGGLVIAIPFSGLTELEAAAFRKIDDTSTMTELDKLHMPKVTLPPVVEDGNQAPIIVEIDHPMEKDHYIKSIQIMNFNDPVVIKGQCFFTPQSGQAFMSTQIRLAGGESRVWVVSECNQHGKWAVSRDVKVAAGGC